MKIGVIPAYSITAYKQLSAFPKGKFETLGITDITTPFNTLYTEFLMYCVEPSLARILVGTKDILDLMVVHIEPTIPALMAKQYGHKTVVVVSDLEMVRSLTSNPVEAKILSETDGIVYANESFRDYVNKQGIKTTDNQVVCTLYVSKNDYATPITKKGGIVYQGTILPPSMNQRMAHRNFASLCDTFDDLDMEFTIYPSSHSRNNMDYYVNKYSYRTQKAHIHLGRGLTSRQSPIKIMSPLNYKPMLCALGDYHWGFMGIDKEGTYMDRLMPHKVFDYMAAGIPMIAMNCSHAGKFIEKEGIGITVKSVKEIKERYNEWEECQKNVLAVRDKWAMENHIDKVINVFENAINGGK